MSNLKKCSTRLVTRETQNHSEISLHNCGAARAGRRPGPGFRFPLKWWVTMSFEFFYRTGAPTQVEDGNFRLNIRFLKHSSVA